MKLFNRFAQSDWTRSLALLPLLLIAPLGSAQNGEDRDVVAFDVPDNDDRSITINLLRLGLLRPEVALLSAEFVVGRRSEEPVRDFDALVVGQYCVTISNPGEDLFENDAFALNIRTGPPNIPTLTSARTGRSVNRAAAPNPGIEERIIVVTDNNDRSVDVGPDDPSCNPAPVVNQSPIASLVIQPMVPDSDARAGELVLLDASGSTDPDGKIINYEFIDQNGNTLINGSNATPTVPLPDGETTVTVIVTDNSEQDNPPPEGAFSKVSRTSRSRSNYGYGEYEGPGGYGGGSTATASATVVVQAPGLQFNNLTDIAARDTDFANGEQVTIDVSNQVTVPANVQVTYQFFLNPGGESSGTPATPVAPGVLRQRFPDGKTTVRVVALAGDQRAQQDIVITVAPPSAVVANAGLDITTQDTDGRLGEIVTLNASGSTTTPGATATFQWFLNPAGQNNGQLLGTGPTIAPRIPDGVSVVRLVATLGDQTSIDELTVTINTRQFTSLATLPNLTPNQRRTALALDDVCSRLLNLESGALTGVIITDGPSVPAAAALTADQSDLTEKCRGIVFNNTVDNQVEAVQDITPEDFAVARTQALLFANTQYTSVLDRLIALRGGARGLSLAGLNIVIDGQNVPLAAIQEMFGKIFGSGASADATEEPGLLSDKWGMWVRGNFSTGGRDRSLVSPSFDADQTGVVIGTDYRLSNNAVIGASIGYLDSSIDFNPAGEGSLDTKSMALSVYGSLYAAKSFYLDGLVNFAKADYDASRNISYNQGSGLVPIGLDAKGSTDGDTLSAGLSGGYDFLVKGVTIAPNAGFFYVDTTIDGFTEDGGGGFNLLYDDQKYKSLTANLGFRVNAVWNLPWLVLLPGVRVDYVREFEDDTDIFRVRFAADPNGLSAPPIVIQTDNPDTSYYRTSINLSAQFKFGFAGYIEYQRIDGFNQIDFQDLAFGFRMQRSF